jgi:hypothetical protein
MRKPKRKASRLTTKSTNEGIVRWTRSHDVFDRRETGISEVVEDHSDRTKFFEKRFSSTIRRS